MGLSIHYDLSLPHIKSAKEARAFVAKLRKFAKTLPLKEVSKLTTWDRSIGGAAALLHAFPIYDRDAGPDAELFFAKPLEMILFVVLQPGSEPAVFGLARYSKTARSMDETTTRPSNLPGWHWHHSCKTQYASMSNEGGWPNFYAIHDGICKILDHAGTLGAQVQVLDESKYWEHRDPARLRQEINRWNAMIAAVVGRFKDMAHADGSSVDAAPILQDAGFEHLEAQGQEFLHQPSEMKVIRLPRKRPTPRRRKK